MHYAIVVKATTIVKLTNIRKMSNSNFNLKFKFFYLVLSALGLFPCLAWGVDAVGSFPSTASVLQPLTITGTSTLSFGSFIAGTGGTVVIPSISPYTRSASGNVTLVSSGPGSVANITVSGLPNTTYTITLPASPVILSNTTAGVTMTVSKFETNMTTANAIIPTLGVQTFQIGGTLNVASNQASGVYNGTVPLTITYN